MKVYVVLDNNWQHYEGGGAEIVSIHGSKDGALAKVRAKFKELNKNRYKGKPLYRMRARKNEPDCWYYCENGAADYWYSIEEHDVIGEETP